MAPQPLQEGVATTCASRIAFDMLPRQPAQQVVHRHSERLALDVSQRHIERAESMQLLARCGGC
jgi:hypothetical protein